MKVVTKINASLYLWTLALIMSCGSTKFTITEGQAPLLVPKNTVVLVKEMPGSTEIESQELFDNLSESLGSSCIRFLYVPEMQYDFVASGIDAEAMFEGDSANLAKLRDWLPRSYFLSMSLGFDRWKHGMVKPVIVQAPTEIPIRPTREAGLFTTIQSTSDLNAIWSFKTETETDGINYGDVGVNVAGSAFRKAFKKTISYLDEKSFADCD